MPMMLRCEGSASGPTKKSGPEEYEMRRVVRGDKRIMDQFANHQGLAGCTPRRHRLP